MTEMTAAQARRGARVRLLTRVCGEFVLRFAEVVRPIFGHDVTLPFVFLAIMQANVRDITAKPELNLKYGGDDTPPDEMRKPISVLGLAESLQMPRETARRYVRKLTEMGLVVQVGRQGVIVPGTIMADPGVLDIMETQAINVRRLLSQLRDAGYDPG